MPKYTLTAEVIGGHGTISPTDGSFYAGTRRGDQGHARIRLADRPVVRHGR